MGSGLDKSSKQYIDKNLPPIMTSWSKEELMSRASPEFKKNIDNTDFDEFLGKLKQLGPYISYEGSTGHSNIDVDARGVVKTASYTATALFQYGKVEVKVKLIQENGDWQILGFHINILPK